MITLLVLVYGIEGDALRGEYPEVCQTAELLEVQRLTSSMYTKEDEAEIVKQHFDDQILDNMTFKDLYGKRIVTALAHFRLMCLRSGTTGDL